MARVPHAQLIHTLLVALPAMLAVNGAQAQVQYFDHVPTAAEIRVALGRPAPGEARLPSRPTSRRKGIEWHTAAPMGESSGSSGQGLALPVTFDPGAARVSKASMAYVGSIASVLAEDPSLRLVVEGHTDATGATRANTMLSWERAFSVFRVLVDRYGIDPDRLQPVGKGSSEPLRPSDPADAMNRRVQFRVAGTAPA